MADDEQFSLCWNNFNTNLSAGFHESLIQGDLVDVTLAAEGQLVKAHRLILSVCSPYFRKMFTQMPANQHAFIFLKDVSHSALKDLIQFMYCGEVNVKQDALPAFISTAEALQIKGLTETGESAPAQQSPAKDTSHHLPSSGVTTIPSSASSPRAKPVQRSRIQSYKIDSDNESEHEKVVQIQATSTSTNASSSSTGPSATIVATQVSTAPQQVQIIQQQQQAQKRTLQQRASITPQTTQIMKRAKLSDPLEAPEPAQIQTVQIVKQITQTPQPTISSEPEYVEMPIETINPKAEPDYVDDPSEVEAIETEHEHEHEHEQALTEHEAAEHEQDADDNYVEDETYGEMAKYDESYFTEGEEVKAGASGFGSESYTDCGTAADQAAQDKPITDDYRNHPADFELPDPIRPGVSTINSHRPIEKINAVDGKTAVVGLIARTYGKKARPVTDIETVIATRSPQPMVVVPTRKGGVGINHGGHHFEYHFARKSRKSFRCVWHLSHRCTAQIVTFQGRVYVISDQHSHDKPSRMSDDVLGKITLKGEP
ncbi:modifier of mdg4-like isoform X4 [Toxorhynchites rutilus septentrionalis]|uniref:modifier of mdg4-like isoform X4 n=1 Tax=Toxorhynchites rutilus septentrionalis TaxID=329112 RepID=UPI002478E4E0|nr:modifier of mdg4-like isoform X4 [Toxorhynchites rutilus septentrionalis]